MTDTINHLEILAKSLEIDPDKVAAIDKSIAYATEKLWGEFQDRLDKVIVFGFYDRGTLVAQDPDADVDIMVLFKKKEVQPQTYLKQLKNFGEKYYNRSDIYRDFPTVAIDMRHIKLEFVPAYLDTFSNEKKIPDRKNKEFKWISTNPTNSKNRLIEKAKATKGAAIRVIKIVKYLNILHEKPFDSFLDIERMIVNSDISSSDLRSFYMEAIRLLLASAKTEQQIKFAKVISERHRRLRVLEKERMPEYIHTEMELFLPLPK